MIEINQKMMDGQRAQPPSFQERPKSEVGGELLWP